MKALGVSRRAVLATGGGLVLALAACSQAVLVRPAPSYEAFAFESSLPAAAAVFVDADQLFREVRMTPDPVDGDSLCDEVSYPVDAREALEVSVVGTLEDRERHHLRQRLRGSRSGGRSRHRECDDRTRRVDRELAGVARVPG